MKRNIGITIVVAIMIIFAFYAPVFPTGHYTPVNYGLASAKEIVTGSLTYVAFHCGEIYWQIQSSYAGQTVSSFEKYQWVC